MAMKEDRRAYRYPAAVAFAMTVVAVLTIVLAFASSQAEASRPFLSRRRPLDILMRLDSRLPEFMEFQVTQSRRGMGEGIVNINAKDDRQACELDRLQQCAPSAHSNYQFPTFESKKEVPNGPNPLHN